MDTPDTAPDMSSDAAEQIRRSFEWAWDHARFHPEDRGLIIPILCGLVCLSVGTTMTEDERFIMERRAEGLVAIEETHAGIHDDDPFI